MTLDTYNMIWGHPTASFAVAVLEGQPERAALRFAGECPGWLRGSALVTAACILHALLLLGCSACAHDVSGTHVPGPPSPRRSLLHSNACALSCNALLMHR